MHELHKAIVEQIVIVQAMEIIARQRAFLDVARSLNDGDKVGTHPGNILYDGSAFQRRLTALICFYPPGIDGRVSKQTTLEQGNNLTHYSTTPGNQPAPKNRLQLGSTNRPYAVFTPIRGEYPCQALMNIEYRSLGRQY